MVERIEEITYQKDNTGQVVSDKPFMSSPAEFLLASIKYGLELVPQWRLIFGDQIDIYKRMDYSIRELPALRMYNEINHKDFESWWIEGDIKADIILPAVLRRDDLTRVQDTLSMALLQQFRRPLFFDAMGVRVPGLNELGKRFSVDKSLGFQWDEDWVPLTQIIINFKIDLRIWDDYLEATDRTKDSPFEAVLGSLTSIAGTIKGLQDDLVTTDIELGINQTPGSGPAVQGDE